MNHYNQIIYLLGQIKATIKGLCFIAMKEDSPLLLDLLVEFEQEFNQQIRSIFDRDRSLVDAIAATGINAHTIHQK